jgi:putative FmdB family regulatory protein
LPIYEYRCTNGHVFEVMQRMSDAPVAACTQCAEPVQRVFHPVAVHFKGSGFYTTDYGRNRAGGGDSSATSGDSAKDKETTTSKTDSGKSDSGKSDSGTSESAKSDSTPSS